jgi:methyl-accepting chemotaxis protein
MVKKGNHRRVYFVERKFQTSFILKFCTLVFVGSLLTGTLVYFFSQQSTTVVFEHSRALVKSTADFLLPLLIQTIIVVCAIVATAAIILTLYISHKIAGPLHRLKKEFAAIGFGDLVGDFSLRKGDQLQDIAVSMSEMVRGLRDKIADLKNNWRDFKDSWQGFLNRGIPADARQVQDIEKLKQTIARIEKDLDYFKIHR